MREAAERRQQLELEHEQALAVLNAKQQEIDLLQKVRGFQPHQTLGWSSCTGQSVEDLASYLRLLVYLNKPDSDLDQIQMVLHGFRLVQAGLDD